MSSSRCPTIAAHVTEPRSVSLSTASKLIQQVAVDWFLEFRNAFAASMTGITRVFAIFSGGLHGISTEAGPWEVITLQPWTAPGEECGFTTLRPNKTFLTKQGWFTTPFFNIYIILLSVPGKMLIIMAASKFISKTMTLERTELQKDGPGIDRLPV